MEQEPFFGTFWRPSFIKIQERSVSPYEFYAVVRAGDHRDIDGRRTGSTLLKGWKLEYRENSIYHPVFGVIPKETCKDYNMFVPSDERKRLDIEFVWPSQEVQLIGTDIEKVIETFEARKY